MANATAKAIRIESWPSTPGNSLEHLRLVDLPIPEPKEGQVLIQVYLRPINPTDNILLQGGWGTQFPLPRVPGSDGVARVLKNGPGATKFQPGQRVVVVQWQQFSEGGGSWTTHTVVPEETLFAVPDSIDDKVAAQFFINPVTAYGMVKEVAVPPGKWLLQTAAGSVLGRMIIALAKHHGFKTINVVRRSDAVQELLDAGADAVIATDRENIVEKVKSITGGEMAYAAIDAVAGKQVADVVAALRKGGHYMAYGLLDPSPVQLSVLDLVGGAKVVRGFLIYQWIERPDKEEAVQAVWKLLEDKVIEPFLGNAYPLEDFKEAIAKSNEVGRGGKVFLQG